MNFLYTIIIAVVILFLITFAVDNTEPVSLSYYSYLDKSIPLYIIIFVSFFTGVVFTGFLGIIERFRQNRTIKHLNKTIRDLHRETRAKENNFTVPPSKTGEETVSQENKETNTH
jgi:lipopolysaccharide assembly protein A